MKIQTSNLFEKCLTIYKVKDEEILKGNKNMWETEEQRDNLEISLKCFLSRFNLKMILLKR